MFVEITAAMSAIKETTALAKVISNAKTQAEINSAVSDMVSKLMSVQRECMSLIELARFYQEEAVTLKAKIAEFEDFKSQTEGYVLNQLDSGTFVYSKNESVNGMQIAVHLCPKCFTQKIVSILQPTGEVGYNSNNSCYFEQCKCFHCASLFLMNKSAYEPIDIAPMVF